jgi:hypothetical protein
MASLWPLEDIMARKSKFTSDDIKRAFTKANSNVAAAAKLVGMSYGGYQKRVKQLGLLHAAKSQKAQDTSASVPESNESREERESKEAYERYNTKRRAEQAIALLDVCGQDKAKAIKAIDAVLSA